MAPGDLLEDIISSNFPAGIGRERQAGSEEEDVHRVMVNSKWLMVCGSRRKFHLLR